MKTNETKPMSFRFTDADKARLRRLANDLNMSMTDVLRNALAMFADWRPDVPYIIDPID